MKVAVFEVFARANWSYPEVKIEKSFIFQHLMGLFLHFEHSSLATFEVLRAALQSITRDARSGLFLRFLEACLRLARDVPGFNTRSRFVSAAGVSAAHASPRSMRERCGFLHGPELALGTIATAVRTTDPSGRRSRRRILPA